MSYRLTDGRTDGRPDTPTTVTLAAHARRGLIKFLPQAHIAKNSTLLVILLFVTGENHAFASTFSRWSGVDFPLLALAASLPSCGRRLRLYYVIEIPRAISRNNARVRLRTFRRIVLERKGLRTCGFRQRLQQAYRFRMICVTQFRIFARKYPFSQSGSHIWVFVIIILSMLPSY